MGYVLPPIDMLRRSNSRFVILDFKLFNIFLFSFECKIELKLRQEIESYEKHSTYILI